MHLCMKTSQELQLTKTNWCYDALISYQNYMVLSPKTVPVILIVGRQYKALAKEKAI